ncbi:MAG: hypothetical protein EBT36_12925 [Betaproteobacteria bacterium]|nr:hypothetical protein [Betaproteobacteria bacterium]
MRRLMLHRIGKIALIAASGRPLSMPVFAQPSGQEPMAGPVWRLGDLVEFPPLKRIDGEVAHAPPRWQAIFRQRKGLPQLFLFDRAGVLRQIELREMLEDDVDALSRYL